MSMALHPIEEEIVFLKAIKEIIDSMVNREILTVQGTDPDSDILFHSGLHQRLFNVLLVDFLSKTEARVLVGQSTYLGALQAIVANPGFSVDDSVATLRDAVVAFADWLGQKISVDVSLPSIDKQATIRISRLTFLKMCGNISKHNMLRLGRVVEEFQQTLTENGVCMDMEDAMLALDDFYIRFHGDVFNYHGSNIAEYLNDIRWGIYEYLQPEYRRSLVWEAKGYPMYRYDYPDGVTNKYVQQCFASLMDEVRQEPSLRRFKVTKWLKVRY